MVSLTSLVVPIVVSAIFVFIASFLLHTVLPVHRNDFRKLPSEDGFLDAIRRLNIPPGDYLAPRPPTRDAMKQPEFVEKVQKGPIAILTVAAGGSISMGRNLLLWFLYLLVVSTVAAYITSRALPPGAPYLEVFRFAGCTAFASYSLAVVQESVWYMRNWGTTMKSVFDGLVYGLLTAGSFGWLWPQQ
jgi:hypothetical protein